MSEKVTKGEEPAGRVRRRVLLPVSLFLLTCLSTFWAGSTGQPAFYLGDALEAGSLMPIRAVVARNWQLGMVYMASVLGILFAHEMGHFLATVRYRIPASFPFFLPLPVSHIGTIGAVIGMDGRRANRKEIFDIGIAGPLAGLVIAIPVMWHGVNQFELQTQNGMGGLRMQMPLLVRWMMDAAPGVTVTPTISLGEMFGNPYFLAGWVGLLITGLNMLPVGQLDGGHVLYCVFGPKSKWVARTFMACVVAYIASDIKSHYIWILMTVLILFVIGVDHPPTKDDKVEIGLFRKVLGTVTLAIPFLCLPPTPIQPL